MMNRWLLPENISDVLPNEARQVEGLRRVMLDRFQTYGYELVIPPMLEFLESLLTGTGHDLDLQMFKLVDQFSGRTMGVRADMTPQVARIDAHLLNRSGVTRLCYAGTTLKTRVSPGTSSREQLQLGAEVYGHSGWEADLEVMTLMLESLDYAQLGSITLDLSHVGLVSEVVSELKLSPEQISTLYSALQSKDIGSLKSLTATWSEASKSLVMAFLEFSGEAKTVLTKAEQLLPITPKITQALKDLQRLCDAVTDLPSKPQVNIDLADLRGYQYHTGVMFAAYVDHFPAALARGGRYDEVGGAFGRSRPATGFSLDILTVARLSARNANKTAILAPWSSDKQMCQVIAELRNQHQVVIQLLPGQTEDVQGLVCDRELVFEAGSWKVISKIVN